MLTQFPLLQTQAESKAVSELVVGWITWMSHLPLLDTSESRETPPCLEFCSMCRAKRSELSVHGFNAVLCVDQG